MTYLFETNVISEQRRADRLPAQVASWLNSISLSEAFVSVITLQEIEFGILLKERSGAFQGAILRRWQQNMVSKAFVGRILPVDRTVAECCAALLVPDRRAELDALIAATAIVNGKTLVTRNVADFRGMLVTVLDPWNMADV